MQVTIQTTQGLWIVPDHKEAELVYWLQQNAIKAGQQPVYEQGQQNQGACSARQLLSENQYRGEF